MNALPGGELLAGSCALLGSENPLHESNFRFTPHISPKQPDTSFGNQALVFSSLVEYLF